MPLDESALCAGCIFLSAATFLWRMFLQKGLSSETNLAYIECLHKFNENYRALKRLFYKPF